MSRLPRLAVQALLRQRALRARDALDARAAGGAPAQRRATRSSPTRASTRPSTASAATDEPVTKAELMERFDDWVTDPRLRRDDVERALG